MIEGEMARLQLSCFAPVSRLSHHQKTSMHSYSGEVPLDYHCGQTDRGGTCARLRLSCLERSNAQPGPSLCGAFQRAKPHLGSCSWNIEPIIDASLCYHLRYTSRFRVRFRMRGFRRWRIVLRSIPRRCFASPRRVAYLLLPLEQCTSLRDRTNARDISCGVT